MATRLNPKLSIVILNWNSQDDLVSCLDKIERNTKLKEKELIVVDNGSRDGSVEILERNYPHVRLIKNLNNRGVGPARNQGIKIANGRYILVLDVDTLVGPGAIDVLIREMDRRPEVGLSGAKLVSPDRELQYTCREFPTVLSKFLFRRLPARLSRRLLRREEYRDWDHLNLAYVGYVIGACQLIRKQVVERIGMYDDRIFYGPEDMDYCLRLWRAGWKVMYDPKAQIVHHEHRITKKGFLKQLKNPVFWAHLRGLLIYFGKHRYLFRRPGPFFKVLD